MACLGFSIVPALAKSSYDAGANALGVMTVRFSIAGLFLIFARAGTIENPRHAMKVNAVPRRRRFCGTTEETSC
ncbi:MAG: hypothetical protein EBY93_05845 [Actinobacteria bacterium]|nr:hypothetical protein [Actinomycetota bacterium]